MIKYNDKVSQVCFDRRLYMVLLLAHWKILTLITVLGGIAGGILYHVQEAESLNTASYESTAIFYVEYELKDNGDMYYAYNEVGWSYVVMFDEIVELALAELPFEMSKEEFTSYILSDNGADYKILTITATTSEPEMCQVLLEAFVPALEAYGISSKHIESITCATEPTEPKLVLVIDETIRASIAGMVLGAIASVLIVSLYLFTQDVFYVGTTLEATFALPVVATYHKKDQREKQEDANDTIVLVVAGKTTYGTIHRMIGEAKRQGKEMTGFTLVEANLWIQKLYYR
ncbi:MAG: hypothetical protein R3Y67_00025 [Eubacteriales bacterium]